MQSRGHDYSESRNHSVAASRRHTIRVIISESEDRATREKRVDIFHSVTVSSMGIRLPFEILIAIVGDLRHLWEITTTCKAAMKLNLKM